MPAALYDLHIEAGSDFRPQFVLTLDSSVTEDPDITGYTARLQIRATTQATGSALAEWTTTNNKLVIDGPNRTITVNVAATETAAYTFDKGVYDLEILDASSNVQRLLQGRVTVSREVTR